MAEIVEDILHLILVDDILIVEIIVDVHLRTTVHDRLYIIEQVVEVEVLRLRDILQRDTSVNHLNDLQFALRLVRNRDDAHDIGALYVVLLTIFLDEVDERLTELMRLSLTDTLDLRELFHRLWEGCSHLRERDILKDNIRRQVMLLRYIMTQAFELLIERHIECGGTTLAILLTVHKLTIGHDHERTGLLSHSLPEAVIFSRP